ncbi:hypothetical protein B1207_07810 [Legionella quinlivanii]|uniref:Lipoprotein n=1 Tax=Legionella quinlivanii TaxID=45073 RepID=A0A364LJL8_9GAMM|nr:hypothetical protein [Legionella quinlivanii]RAP36696.1 hypothetical protein B1207_07810 [Legionella quinlivanii]
MKRKIAWVILAAPLVLTGCEQMDSLFGGSDHNEPYYHGKRSSSASTEKKNTSSHQSNSSNNSSYSSSSSSSSSSSGQSGNAAQSVTSVSDSPADISNAATTPKPVPSGAVPNTSPMVGQ